MYMNIYQMYCANGNQAGFYVQRDTWGNTYAQITKVAGKTRGPLAGIPPYYGNPLVHCDLYNLATGELIDCNAQLSCPGNYSYIQIAKPKSFAVAQPVMPRMR